MIERRIVKNNPNEKYDNILDLVFTKEDGTYNGTDITRSPYNIIHNELGIKKCRFYDSFFFPDNKVKHVSIAHQIFLEYY